MVPYWDIVGFFGKYLAQKYFEDSLPVRNKTYFLVSFFFLTKFLFSLGDSMFKKSKKSQMATGCFGDSFKNPRLLQFFTKFSSDK
jgi:hypothetical protein